MTRTGMAAPARRSEFEADPTGRTPNVSLAVVAQSAPAPSGSDGPAFTAVEVHRDIASVLPLWSALSRDALATPYQAPAFLKTWTDHAAAPEGVEPLIVVARDAAGLPVALLPLGLTRRFGVRVAKFLGGSHVNYNMAVIRRDRLGRFGPQETRRLFDEAAKAARIDAFGLCNLPHVWDGLDNPLAALPRQPSPDPGFSGPLASSLEEHLKLFVSAKSRSNQRRKMRRFEERGTPRIYRAESAAERARLLDAYFDQKARQFAERGVPNVFERPGVHEFLEAACGLRGAAPTVDLYGFDLDDEVIAVTGGVAGGGRYCGMFISITSGEHAKYSPGEMLMNFVVEDSIRRGLSVFDLGVGAAAYKKMYCPNVEPLFDAIFGVTLKGRTAAAGFAALAAAKTRVKSTPWAYRLLQRLRKRAAAEEPGADAPAATTD